MPAAAAALSTSLRCRETAMTAFAHPQGFIRVPLLENSDTRIALHIWPPTVGANPKPHCHNDTVNSFVVQGKLSNTTYVVHDSTDSSWNYYEAWYSKHFSYMRPLDRRATIRVDETISVGPDEHYVVKPGVFHAAQQVGPECLVTVCVMSSPSRVPQYVLTPEYRTAGQVQPLPNLSLLDSFLVSRIIAKLNDA